MSNAIRCNKCDTCFDPLTTNGIRCRFTNPQFFNKEDTKANKVTRYLMDDAPRDAYVDLCPKCSSAFFTFMGEKSPAEVQDPGTNAFIETIKKNAFEVKEKRKWETM